MSKEREITEIGPELYLKLYATINSLAAEGKAQLLADMLLYLCTLSYDTQRSVRWYINDEVREGRLELCNTSTE